MSSAAVCMRVYVYVLVCAWCTHMRVFVRANASACVCLRRYARKVAFP